MHKSFVLILFTVFAFVSFACSCSSEKSQKEAGGENIQTTEGEKAGSSDFTTYENAENGFSMAYPPICHPQNDDAELEKSFRGKLFIGEGAMLSAQCHVKDNGSAYDQSYFDMQYEWASSISDGTEMLKNEKSSTEYVVKSADKEMVHNQRAIFKNGKIYLVDYSYPVSAREKHDKFVDEVLASLKVK
jgi:hypothetical protein